MASFGESMREQFVLSEEYTFLNHGSYGAVAKSANLAKQKKQMVLAAEPDRWFRFMYEKDYRQNVDSAANFLATSSDKIVLVNNATTGTNSILRSIDFTAQDAILIQTWTYGAVKNLITFISENTGAQVIEVQLRLPIHDKQDIVKAYERVISEHSNIKLAVIDVISSVPPILMPFRELIALCKEHNILTFLDGAHSPGQIDVRLDDWKPDFYVGNLHKWAYTNIGCAVMYVSKANLKLIYPSVVSIKPGGTDMRKYYFYQGTNDYTSYCTVTDALQFYEEVGGLNRISEYNSNLSVQAAELLANAWGTRLLDLCTSCRAPFMKMVRLPDLEKYPAIQEVEGAPNNILVDMTELMLLLMDRFKIVALCISCQGEPYVRLSANIYNTLNDYQRLADAILTLKSEENSSSL